MDFLKSLLYSTIWQQKRPNPLEFSILSKLPLELLVVIAQFLPPVSAVSFSQCVQKCAVFFHHYRNTVQYGLIQYCDDLTFTGSVDEPNGARNVVYSRILS